ncbi:S41 family peptidase [Mucilaginibacter sp. OK098]|uniref:S41 family peptidase n=1 Tax=Mucilaginibacter sp. OK098 TaxID=1855297 RepID=UPI00091157A0|nr:S41 family peptidase [Mucilaginibacter sp. OK098]SHM05901.1 Peptidase family S41 [Mucilaginibacter sp. OK098]
MKKLLIACCLIIIYAGLSAQIKNPGFELKSDSLNSLPANWIIKHADGSTTSLDENIKFAGTSSFSIKSIQNVNPAIYSIFSQTFDISVSQLKIIKFSAYIKTENIKGTAALYCQVMDNDNRIIGTQSIDSKSITQQNNDWNKYTISIAVNGNAKKILVGGYLIGEGAVWYDEFSMEEFPFQNTTPSNDVKQYIKEFTDIIKKYSIYTKKLNWAGIDADIDQLSGGIKTIEDAQLLTSYIMSELRIAGDNHSFIKSKAAAVRYANENVDMRLPSAKLLPGIIGYVWMPGFGSTSDTASTSFATTIQNMIRELDTKNDISGWIIDLRHNNGGNMHPMIAGLGPIIGNGTLGYFVSPETNKITPWMYKNGKVTNGSAITAKVSGAYAIKNPGSKVAVLTGPKTASSGEMTTICFIGKPNVKLFGQPTGGYTTGNRGFKLSTGAYLYLASGYAADRNKKEYLGKIDPDVVVKDTNENGDDATIKAATDWIRNK